MKDMSIEKKLIKLQKEYIKFLGKHLSSQEVLSQNRGIMPKDEDLVKGLEMRDKMKELESQLIKIPSVVIPSGFKVNYMSSTAQQKSEAIIILNDTDFVEFIEKNK